MKKQNISRTSGFTLIEILIVIGIIAILAAIVLVAINPARQFRQANNSQRDSNVNAILTALGQYVVDNKGNTEELAGGSGLPNDPTDISDSGTDLCEDLVPNYLPSLPTDPDSEHKGANLTLEECAAGYEDIGYQVMQDEENGRITVSAPLTVNADNGELAKDDNNADTKMISVTR